MALRHILTQGDPTLNKKCRPVTDFNARLHQLLDDMADTLAEANGVGLAAPQMTYIMHALKEHGMDVDVTATTVEEARDTILAALESQKKNGKKGAEVC